MVKNILILLFICCGLNAQVIRANKFHTPPGGAPTWTNLRSWWKMTETSGSVIDYGPAENDGSVTGATQTSSGIVFDGSGNVAINSTAFGTGDFTIICRITCTSSDHYENLFGGQADDLQISFYNRSRPRVLQESGGGSSVADISLGSGVESMFAVVRDGDTFRFFIDGSFEDETLSADFTANNTMIGASTYDYDDLVGIVRDFVIFTDAKADAYITAFYNSGSFTNYEDGDPYP